MRKVIDVQRYRYSQRGDRELWKLAAAARLRRRRRRRSEVERLLWSLRLQSR